MLAAAAGQSNAQIARWLGICEDTVRKWRHRWCAAPGPASISAATVRRWLSEDALKPWRYQSWINTCDPDFAAKAQRVLDLYDRK